MKIKNNRTVFLRCRIPFLCWLFVRKRALNRLSTVLTFFLLALHTPAISQNPAFELDAARGMMGDKYDQIVVAKEKLLSRAAAMRDAGFPMSRIDLSQFDDITHLSAYQRISSINDDCLAAVELKLYLESRWDEPAAEKLGMELLGVWVLPNKFTLADWVTKYFGYVIPGLGHISTGENVISSYDAVRNYLVGSVVYHMGQWAFKIYERSKRERWSAEKIETEMRQCHDLSLEHMKRIEEIKNKFDADVQTEIAKNTTKLNAINARYKNRIQELKEDEQNNSELHRRSKWLQCNPNELPSGVTPRPLINMTHEQMQGEQRILWMNEALPGGKFYESERNSALSIQTGETLLENAKYYVVMKKLAYEYEHAVQEQLTEIMRLQIERQTLEKYSRPLALNECEKIGKINKQSSKSGFITAHHRQSDWYCTNRPVIQAPVTLPPIISITEGNQH